MKVLMVGNSYNANMKHLINESHNNNISYEFKQNKQSHNKSNHNIQQLQIFFPTLRGALYRIFTTIKTYSHASQPKSINPQFPTRLHNIDSKFSNCEYFKN